MLACGKYNLVHEFFRKVEKSSIPNALNYKGMQHDFYISQILFGYNIDLNLSLPSSCRCTLERRQTR